MLIYVQRPDGTALWLPDKLLRLIKAKYRDRLTADQFNDGRVQELLERRRNSTGQHAPLE